MDKWSRETGGTKGVTDQKRRLQAIRWKKKEVQYEV